MPPIQQSIDFSNLSDTELSQMLIDYGVDVGPINVATRKAYERKLSRLKTGQISSPTTQYEPVDDDDDDDEEQDEGAGDNDDSEIQFRMPEVQSFSRQPTASVTPGRRPELTQTRLRRDVADYSSTPRVEARPGLASIKRTTLSSAPPSSQKAEASKGIPMWVKLLALLVVVVLVYLIYSNMEPQAVSNIPAIPNKVEV